MSDKSQVSLREVRVARVRAAAPGPADGAAPLFQHPAVHGLGAVACRAVARVLAGAGGLAIGGSSAGRGTAGSGVASLGAPPAPASDRQPHAVPDDPAGGLGAGELGVAEAGIEPSAAERRLARGARSRSGTRGDVHGSVAVHGARYRASNRTLVGLMKGFARHNGAYTDAGLSARPRAQAPAGDGTVAGGVHEAVGSA